MTLIMNDVTTVFKLNRIPKVNIRINVILEDETRISAKSEMYIKGKMQENIEKVNSNVLTR